MLALRFQGKDYPIEYRHPSAGDERALVVRKPESKEIVAFLKWNAYTHQIQDVKVGKTKADARVYRRQGIATALLAQARQYETVKHHSWRTDDGEAWARSLGERLPKRQAI